LSVEIAPLKDTFSERLALAGASPQLLLGARLAIPQMPGHIEITGSELAACLPPAVRLTLGHDPRAGLAAAAACVMVILSLAGARAGLRWIGAGLLLNGIGLIAASTQLDYVLAAVPVDLGLGRLAFSPEAIAEIRSILGAVWHELVAQARVIPAVCAAAGAAVGSAAGLLGARGSVGKAAARGSGGP
jgi:hypothetical protein